MPDKSGPDDKRRNRAVYQRENCETAQNKERDQRRAIALY